MGNIFNEALKNLANENEQDRRSFNILVRGIADILTKHIEIQIKEDDIKFAINITAKDDKEKKEPSIYQRRDIRGIARAQE